MRGLGRKGRGRALRGERTTDARPNASVKALLRPRHNALGPLWISSIAIHDAASVFPMTYYTQRLQMINFAQSLCRCLLS